MGLFDRIARAVRREAEDLADLAEEARDKLDDELSRREAELEMTPSERIEQIQRDAARADAQFDHVFGKVAEQSSDAQSPSVTEIVLPDGTVHSGTDTGETEAEIDAGPQEGELDWVAPREGDQAIVPAFGIEPGPDELPAGPQYQALPAPEPLVKREDEGPAPLDSAPPPPRVPRAEAPSVDAATPESATPPPSQPRDPEPEPAQAPTVDAATPEPTLPTASEPEPADREPSGEPERPETPAAVAEPSFDKTPAQIKYEEARAAAAKLLEELRGELREDGEID